MAVSTTTRRAATSRPSTPIASRTIQSVMNYLFQLDGVGPNAAVAYSNQTLDHLDRGIAGIGYAAYRFTQAILRRSRPRPGTVRTPPSPTASPATLHCDGTPLDRRYGLSCEWADRAHRPSRWSNGQNITFDGQCRTPYAARIQRLGQHRPASGGRHRRRVRGAGQRAFLRLPLPRH